MLKHINCLNIILACVLLNWRFCAAGWATYDVEVPERARGAKLDSFPSLISQVHVGEPDSPVLQRSGTVDDCSSCNITDGRFPCRGKLMCAGTLYLPGPRSGGPALPPIIVMAHGLGGDKSELAGYASSFAAAGFAVLAFDYRYWGASQGTPRRWVQPKAQVEDWISAVQHVQGPLAQFVDANRLSLWGTSFAGGHVVSAAAQLKGQLRAIVSQVPHMDGPIATGLSMLFRGVLGNTVLSAASLADVSTDIKAATSNLYVPLVR